MARAWGHHQQVSREKPKSRTSEPDLGAWYGKPIAYTLYILLVRPLLALLLLSMPD